MKTRFINFFDLNNNDAAWEHFKKNIAFFGAILLVIGLVFSPALQSIGVALIFSAYFFKNNTNIQFEKDVLSLGLIALLGISFLSGIYGHNHDEYWKKIIVKLPFVLLGISFLGTSLFNQDKINKILSIFSWSVFVAALITCINYLLNFNTINEQLLHSKPIYILYAVERADNRQVNHIYFSIMLAFAIWCSYYLYKIKFGKKYNYVMLLQCIGLIILLHVIGARTGLLGFYASTIVALLWVIIKEKKYKTGLLFGVFLLTLFFSAYKFLPAWQNRLANTKEDLGKMKEGKNINHYSISMRKEALKTAWEIYCKNPILGVGAGDLQQAMEQQYTADQSILIPENRKLPHNQFIQELSTTGILGLIILCSIFILPFSYKNAWNNLMLISFLVICFSAFQVESAL